MDTILFTLLALLIGILIGWYLTRRLTKKAVTDQQSLQMQLAMAEDEIKRLQIRNNEAANQVKLMYEKADHLEDINGIGPVFAKRLNEAGIFTFAHLATLTPERINEIISPENWQAINPAEWVAQAQQFSKGIPNNSGRELIANT